MTEYEPKYQFTACGHYTDIGSPDKGDKMDKIKVERLDENAVALIKKAIKNGKIEDISIHLKYGGGNNPGISVCIASTDSTNGHFLADSHEIVGLLAPGETTPYIKHVAEFARRASSINMKRILQGKWIVNMTSKDSNYEVILTGEELSQVFNAVK